MPRIVYCLATLLLAWLLMQAVHELGHVIGAVATGGHVTQVVLHPLTISRTDVSPNPMPLLEVWAGPVIGLILPILLWFTALKSGCALSSWLRFFAGFCLIANASYIGYGVLEPVGDAEELLRHGSPPWLLGAFGLITAPLGLKLWHGLGREFGWGADSKTVSWRAAIGSLIALTMVVILELLFNQPPELPH